MVYRPMNLPQNIQAQYYRDPRLRLSSNLIEQGTSTAPVEHWAQGLGRLAQALAGTYIGNRADEEYRERGQRYADDLGTIMSPQQLPATEMDPVGDSRPATMAEMLARAQSVRNPDLGPMVQNLALTAAQQQAQEDQFNRRSTMEDRRWQQRFDIEGQQRQRERQEDMQFRERLARMGAGSTPASIQEWNAFQRMTPAEQERYLLMKRSNPYINLGGSMGQPSQTQPGTLNAEIPKTVPPEQSPDIKGQQAAATAAARAAAEKQALRPKASMALQQFERKTQTVTDTIDKALNLAQTSSTATGWGNRLLSGLPDTDARALNNYLDTIRANIGFDQLTQMRESSPTGGALGSVTENENRLLQAVQGAMDPLQGEQLVQNLQVIRALYPQVLAEKRAAFQSDYGENQPESPQNRRKRYNPATGQLEDIQ